MLEFEQLSIHRKQGRKQKKVNTGIECVLLLGISFSKTKKNWKAKNGNNLLSLSTQEIAGKQVFQCFVAFQPVSSRWVIESLRTLFTASLVLWVYSFVLHTVFSALKSIYTLVNVRLTNRNAVNSFPYKLLHFILLFSKVMEKNLDSNFFKTC